MTKKTKILTLAILTLLLGGCAKKDAAAIAEAERDKQFQQMMTGAVMIGYSTRDNKGTLSKEERYAIDKASRLAGDTWLLQSRMNLGDRDVPIPAPVTIKWAGDTPVITVTDMGIPGMGSTYTARILLYRDRYAGYWSNSKGGGGTMFGRIERPR